MNKSEKKYIHIVVNFATVIILVALLVLAALWYIYGKNIKDYNRMAQNSQEIGSKLYEHKQEQAELKRKRLHIETPDSVRAIYMSSWISGHKKYRKNLVDFIEKSEINAVVMDIKDSTGVISFPVDDAEISKLNTDSNRISDVKDFIKLLHEKDIYVIGRLTAFQDPLLAKRIPKLAFQRIDNGQTWTDRKGLAFINPKNKESWDYLVNIALHSYDLGFDEINFDYIRYPSDGNIKNINYKLDGETRASVLKAFYAHLDKELRSKNIPISADFFGLTTSADDDLGIGQVLVEALPYFDAIAPMVYPSHYSSGYFGLDKPEAKPYEVIHASMSDAIEKAKSINEDPQKLRTWIQDFSLAVPYGEKEVRDQLRANTDIGLDSYMVWDPKNKYTQSAYE